MIKLGKQLQKDRLEAGLSQRQVAKSFKYTTPQFVSNWERGLVVPPLPTLVQLGTIYKTNTKNKWLNYQRRIADANW